MSLFLQSTVPVRLFVFGGHDSRLRLALSVPCPLFARCLSLCPLSHRGSAAGAQTHPSSQTPESGAEDLGSGIRSAACSPGMFAVTPLASKSRHQSVLHGGGSVASRRVAVRFDGGDAGDGGVAVQLGEESV